MRIYIVVHVIACCIALILYGNDIVKDNYPKIRTAKGEILNILISLGYIIWGIQILLG